MQAQLLFGIPGDCYNVSKPMLLVSGTRMCFQNCVPGGFVFPKYQNVLLHLFLMLKVANFQKQPVIEIVLDMEKPTLFYTQVAQT